jgi:hypothetical protein
MSNPVDYIMVLWGGLNTMVNLTLNTILVLGNTFWHQYFRHLSQNITRRRLFDDEMYSGEG